MELFEASACEKSGSSLRELETQTKKIRIVLLHNFFLQFSYCTLSLDFYSVFPKDKIGLRNKQIQCDHNSELFPAVRTAYILSVLIED